MPAELWEHQYELAPADSVGDGFVFGTEETGYLTLERPTHSGGDVQSADQARPYEDGTSTGRDFRGSKSVSFTIGVLTDLRNAAVVQSGTVLRTNLDYLDYFETRWTDPALRTTPRATAMLRTCEGGRTSRAYGRPRRYEEAVGDFTEQGYTPVACDFMLVENAWYDDVESSTVVSLAPPTDGGFEVPFQFPLTFSGNESAAAQPIVVGGRIDTWAVVEFHGPSINPQVQIGDLTIGLTESLGFDDIIVVDPRPWRRTVLRRRDSANFRGSLSGRSPAMVDMKLTRGEQSMVYTALDNTGSSKAVVRWRNARNRP